MEIKYIIGTGDFMNRLTSRLGQHRRKVSKLEKKYEKNPEWYSGGYRDEKVRKVKICKIVKRYVKQNEKI